VRAYDAIGTEFPAKLEERMGVDRVENRTDPLAPGDSRLPVRLCIHISPQLGSFAHQTQVTFGVRFLESQRREIQYVPKPVRETFSPNLTLTGFP